MIENRPLADFLAHLTLVIGVVVIGFPLYLTFIASTHTSDEMAYWIVKLMWENRKDLVSANALLSFIDLPTVATGVQLELHPGAKKFYQEIGAKMD